MQNVNNGKKKILGKYATSFQFFSVFTNWSEVIAKSNVSSGAALSLFN